jgi:hypothetical protein
VREAYLAYSDTMLDWFETLATEDFAATSRRSC